MAGRKKNNEKGNSEYSPLWEALLQLDAKEVLILWGDGADINETIDQGPVRKISPLMVAAEHFDLTNLKKVVESGADINARTEGTEISTPLKSAIMSDSLEKVQYLVDRGADVNPFASGETTFSPLALAAVRGGVDIFSFLLSKGADSQWRDHKNATILKIAVNEKESEEQIQIVKKLIELGVSPDEPDNEGFSPIHNAAASGNLGVIEALIDAGVSLDQPIVGEGDDAGHRPLRKAATGGHLEAFELLISKGADINLLIPSDQTFKIMNDQGKPTVKFNEELDLLSAILFHGFQDDPLDEDREEIISILCNAGAEPTMFTLAYVMIFPESMDCKELLFKKAEDNLRKFIKDKTIDPFIKSILVLSSQNWWWNSECIYEELCDLINGFDMDEDLFYSYAAEIEARAEEIVEIDELDKEGEEDFNDEED